MWDDRAEIEYWEGFGDGRRRAEKEACRKKKEQELSPSQLEAQKEIDRFYSRWNPDRDPKNKNCSYGAGFGDGRVDFLMRSGRLFDDE